MTERHRDTSSAPFQYWDASVPPTIALRAHVAGRDQSRQLASSAATARRATRSQRSSIRCATTLDSAHPESARTSVAGTRFDPAPAIDRDLRRLRPYLDVFRGRSLGLTPVAPVLYPRRFCRFFAQLLEEGQERGLGLDGYDAAVVEPDAVCARGQALRRRSATTSAGRW